MPPRFPVLWLTILAFGLVAVASMDFIVGGIFVVVILPTVLLCQWCIRWMLGRLKTPVWLRRSAMLLPALVLATGLFHETNAFGGKQAEAVTVALAGHKPAGMRDLQVHEDAWTDYEVRAFFRCDPESLRLILEKPPFIRSKYTRGRFSFAETPFADLQALPDVKDVVVYQRTDLERAKGLCFVYTDSSLSFAYVVYSID